VPPWEHDVGKAYRLLARFSGQRRPFAERLPHDQRGDLVAGGFAQLPGRPDPGLAAIISERRQLINLGYRLVGSLAEAEDAVQGTRVAQGLDGCCAVCQQRRK
jgi:hypothetical protein